MNGVDGSKDKERCEMKMAEVLLATGLPLVVVALMMTSYCSVADGIYTNITEYWIIFWLTQYERRTTEKLCPQPRSSSSFHQ